MTPLLFSRPGSTAPTGVTTKDAKDTKRPTGAGVTDPGAFAGFTRGAAAFTAWLAEDRPVVPIGSRVR